MNNDAIFNLLNKVNELNHINSEKIKLKHIQIHPETSDEKIDSLKEIFGKTLSALPTGTETDFGKASPNIRTNENPMNMQEVQAFLRKQFQKISSQTDQKQVKDLTISQPFLLNRPVSAPVNLHPSKDFAPANITQSQEIKHPANRPSPGIKNTKEQPDAPHPARSVMPVSATYPNEKGKGRLDVSLAALPLKHLNAKKSPNPLEKIHSRTSRTQEEMAVSNIDFSRGKLSLSEGALPVHRGKSPQEKSAPAAAPVLFPKPERDALLAILKAIHDKLPGKSTYQPAPATAAKYVSGPNDGLMNALRQTIR